MEPETHSGGAARLYSLSIVENSPIARDCWLLKFKSLPLAQEARPGQFLMIRVSPNLDPLLPRPFSLCQIHPEKGVVSVVYKMSGPGTSWLARRERRETVPVLGPLGNAFQVPEDSRSIALVGGGIGVTPLISLGELMRKQGREIHFFLGLRDRDSITVNESMMAFVPKDRRHFSTDDGSLGEQGNIVDSLARFLESRHVDYVAACGPRPMLEALQPLTKAFGIRTEVAVEQSMACGLGYCQGCVVRVRENGGKKSILACKDGPIVPLDRLVL